MSPANDFQVTSGKTLFVTGTGTSVGKTRFCGLFLAFLKERGIDAGYQKWVSTGGEVPADLAHVMQVAGMRPDPAELDLQVPFRFSFPASPHLAAEMEGREVGSETIIRRFCDMSQKHKVLVVEGAGGLLVPLRRDLLLADLLARLKPPTLIVAGSGLGTLNHTLLTLEAMRNRGIPIFGIVFSDTTEDEDPVLIRDNMRTIAEIGRVTVFGRMERISDLDEAKAAFLPIGEAVLRGMG
ncbi:MAG: dethiobiotin synthase [Desulfobulbaceae bacterium]|nr:dethiobiotin synthase [Desulfobulbaceae bacterium]MCK5544898.1 dethiobiotin synthase [Desulfobulbaceae bacterium]